MHLVEMLAREVLTTRLRMFTKRRSEISLEFCEDVGVGEIWEELLTTSKLLCSTYLKIKGIWSPKALKFKYLKYTGGNTNFLSYQGEPFRPWPKQSFYSKNIKFCLAYCALGMHSYIHSANMALCVSPQSRLSS